MLQRGFQLFDGAHLRETRTIAHQPRKFRKLFRRSYGIYFYAAIVQVPRPARARRVDSRRAARRRRKPTPCTRPSILYLRAALPESLGFKVV